MTMSQHATDESLLVVMFDNTEIDAWGFIPSMINAGVDEPLWKQIDNNYQHGGGWQEIDGFTPHKLGEHGFALSYPDDPEMNNRSWIIRGDEALVLFDHSVIMWTPNINSDPIEYKISRID